MIDFISVPIIEIKEETMKARITIKGVTAMTKGRFTSQIMLSVGDFTTAKRVTIPKDNDEYETAVMPVENKVFDWLSSLQNKSVVISDE